MGGSSGGGGGDSTNTIRYAPYIEDYHKSVLVDSKGFGELLRETNPYSTYNPIEISDAFFGAGYSIASFPSLYDIFGKFMAGLDIEALWEQSLEGTQDSNAIGNMTAEHAKALDDDINENTLPRYQLGLRDVNAVMSSSYLVGKSLIETAKIRALDKFDADMRYKLIPIAADRWNKHLAWNQAVVATHGTLAQLYYNTELATGSQNIDRLVQESLWPFTVMDNERAMLGALQGAMVSKATGGPGEASQTQKAIGGAVSGAAMGYMVGGAWGAAAGAVVGLAASFA